MDYMTVIHNTATAAPQEVVVRNDSSCGSTIGPMMSANLAVRTVDIGTPQLSMHSIREMCCTTGVLQATTLYRVRIYTGCAHTYMYNDIKLCIIIIIMMQN